MPALLRLLAPLANLAALVFLTRRRKVTRALTQAGATTASQAIPLEASGLEAWWLRRLSSDGVIRTTGSGLYWLDSDAYARYRRVRIVRVTVVVAVAFAAWIAWTVAVRL